MNKEENLMAYLAGLMDGDGSFSLCKSLQKKEHSYRPSEYYPCIQLSNACEYLVDILKENFQGTKHVRKSYIAKDGGKRKENYHWMIKGKIKCLPMLERIIPYLVIKKRRAKLLLEYINKNLISAGRAGTQPEKVAERESYYLKMKQLNDQRSLNTLLTKKTGITTGSEIFWSYVAGLFDADGSFSIATWRCKYHRPLIQLSMVDLKSINYILENFTGGKVHLRKATNCKLRVCYKWIIENKQEAKEFCTNLLPFLILKKKQAEILLKFCDEKKEIKYCRGGISQEEVDFREECRLKIKELNMGSINLT